MALQKQSIAINFSKGLDQKSDEKQIPFGKFLRLKNTVFEKIGLLQKRNGFEELASLPDTTSNYLTTFAGNLTAIGTSLEAYSNPTNTWINKGHLQPVELSVLSAYRSQNNQSQCDTAIASNGLICTTFTDIDPVLGTQWKYIVQDSTTGQVVLGPTVLVNASGSARTFVLGGYFIIVFTATISATPHLQYLAVNFNSLVPGTITDVSTIYTPMSTVAFDAVVSNNSLYIAWNGSDAGHSVRIAFLNSMLGLSSPVIFPATGVAAGFFSVTADENSNIYVTFADTTTVHTLTVDRNLNTVSAPSLFYTSATTIGNVTSSALNGANNIIIEDKNSYIYDTSIATNTITVATGILRGLGLASKSFIIDGQIYFLAAYSSQYQPTYFLYDILGNLIAKLAYSNGGGYLTLGLPNTTVIGQTVWTAYLIRDLIEPVNKLMGASNAGLGVYAQTGVNIANFTLTTSDIVTSEIGGDLHLTGGFIWMYDGLGPVEHSFLLWPDNVEIKTSETGGNLTPQEYFYQAIYEWTDNKGNIHRSAPSIPVSFTILMPPATFTGNRTGGSPIITGIASTAFLQAGQLITGTGIPGSTYILSVDSPTQITMTNNASSGTSTSTTITPTAISSLDVDVPTLRVTYKNPVTITLYRWSAGQQTFYKVLSIENYNYVQFLSVDYVTFHDTLADTAIVGNEILYTTGGVVENIAAPASNTMALYKSRLISLDAEDPNLLWYSKQVIEATPVEMSDLFTIYVAPTESVEGTSGPIKALSAMDDKLIVFKGNAIYYITGNGPDNTGANNDFSDPIFITATVGCTNQNSIVFTPNGLMFQSNKGIWLLGRDLSTNYIGAAVEDFNPFIVLSALNIPETNQVRFTLSNGITLVYNYYFGEWSTFEGIPGIASTVFQGLHTFINSFAQVFREKVGSYLDGTNPVLMGLTTGWFNLSGKQALYDLGGLQGFERAYWFNLLGTYISPHKLVVNVAYDYVDSSTQLTKISPDNYNNPYGVDPLYGSTYVYGGTSTLEPWRLFFENQKCEAFQVSIDEIFDPQFGTIAGAGLTLSGLNMIYGAKGNYPRLPASHSVG